MELGAVFPEWSTNEHTFSGVEEDISAGNLPAWNAGLDHSSGKWGRGGLWLWEGSQVLHERRKSAHSARIPCAQGLEVNHSSPEMSRNCTQWPQTKGLTTGKEHDIQMSPPSKHQGFWQFIIINMFKKTNEMINTFGKKCEPIVKNWIEIQELEKIWNEDLNIYKFHLEYRSLENI
jgi:hypothetical protein